MRNLPQFRITIGKTWALTLVKDYYLPLSPSGIKVAVLFFACIRAKRGQELRSSLP
jgi:hypothetical protein